MLHTVLPRFIPATWTVTALVPGDGLLVRLAAVLFAVVAGFVGAGRAGIADAGDGGLGCGRGSEEYGDTEQTFAHIDPSLVGVTVKKVAI